MTRRLVPPLTFAEVAHREGVARTTVYDWWRRGVNNPNGERVYLVVSRVGGRWRVRRRDLKAFRLACQGVALEVKPASAGQKRVDAAIAAFNAKRGAKA